MSCSINPVAINPIPALAILFLRSVTVSVELAPMNVVASSFGELKNINSAPSISSTNPVELMIEAIVMSHRLYVL
jgi:hypothetical protein